jgi:hypothetical protein
MASRKASFIKTTLGVLCIGLSIPYIIAIATPYINPVHFWPLTFLALSYPLVLAAMLLACGLSIPIFKKYSFFFWIGFCLGYKNILAIWGFYPNNKFTMAKPAGSVRILSWNVNEFLNAAIKYDTPGNPRRQMFAFIRQSYADVLCFQDFATDSGRHFRSTLPYIRDSLHYPYSSFVNNFSFGIENYSANVFI